MTDQATLSVIINEQRLNWQNLLPIESVGTLIMQYFCKNKQGDHTLAELFAKVPFHYSLSSDEEDLVTYMAYKEIACGSLRVYYPIQPIRCCFHLSTFVFTATTISH